MKLLHARQVEQEFFRSEHPVLVVDDDASIRRVFCLALERAGFLTLQAECSEDALQLIAHRHIAAILLDHRLPGELDGLDILRRLRNDEATATLPIIVVTGAIDATYRVKILRAGASDFLAKPVDIDELIARVQSQLRGQAAWMNRLEGHLRERAAITRALTQVRPAGTPEATASVVCFELSLLHQLPSVAMFAFGSGNIVTPLAHHGKPITHEHVGEPLAFSWRRYLVERSTRGPWTERVSSIRGSLDIAIDDEKTLAFAPMHAGTELIGVLALAAETQDPALAPGNVSKALSAAIDFASVAAGLLAPSLHKRERDQQRQSKLDDVIAQGAFRPVFQPIVDLDSKKIVGYETLTRFTDGTRPDKRFLEATMLGRGTELELATLRTSLAESRQLPDDVFLSVNVSPTLLMQGDSLHELLEHASHDVVLELTEHDPIDDYGLLLKALERLPNGIRWSVDDAGSGFASLRHVLSLQPHFVKLDLSLVRNIHDDPARQALVAGIEYFATETSSRLIAEGIEFDEEMATLQRLDVELGQGYLLGKPEPIVDLRARVASMHD